MLQVCDRLCAIFDGKSMEKVSSSIESSVPTVCKSDEFFLGCSCNDHGKTIRLRLVCNRFQPRMSAYGVHDIQPDHCQTTGIRAFLSAACLVKKTRKFSSIVIMAFRQAVSRRHRAKHEENYIGRHNEDAHIGCWRLAEFVYFYLYKGLGRGTP
jgi:hypothetical protein